MKQAMRAEVRRRKKQFDREVLDAHSRTIVQRLSESEAWQRARCVLCYYPLADEVDVREALTLALAQGKLVLLPRVVGDDLELLRYESDASLCPGAYGILEPTGEVFPVVRYAEIDLVVVPGMAFDAQGHRLGRGKGYYDRLLPRLTNACRTGVCYGFQLFDEVPNEPHDCVMDAVVTNGD